MSLLLAKVEEQRRKSAEQREMIDSLVLICKKQSRDISKLMEFSVRIQNQNNAFQQEVKECLHRFQIDHNEQFQNIKDIKNCLEELNVRIDNKTKTIVSIINDYDTF